MALAEAARQHFERQPVRRVWLLDMAPVAVATSGWQTLELRRQFRPSGRVPIVLLVVHA
jgi:hypothetical protein